MYSLSDMIEALCCKFIWFECCQSFLSTKSSWGVVGRVILSNVSYLIYYLMRETFYIVVDKQMYFVEQDIHTQQTETSSISYSIKDTIDV